MELRIVMADPAGNRTAIVRTPVLAPLRAQTAARIMQIEDLRVEQVGFEVAPRLGGAGRLEMMGGEFCGNAARSYGYLLCVGREQPHAGEKAEILIEISGYSGLLKVDCEFPDISFAEMPVPDRLDYSAEGYPLVISEGITHMILENMDPDPGLVREYVDRYGRGFDAFGMMFLRGNRLTPVVYVREAASLVYESSCGSGSLAAAWYLAQRSPDQSSFFCTFREPGGSITVRLQRDRNGKLQGSMGGTVQIEEEIVIRL